VTVDSKTALARLAEGNLRFVEGRSNADRFTPASRAAAVEGQDPWAIIVGCSDSRVPVEVVFDAGVGDLFVIRTAGHVLDDTGFASVRFAVEKLGARTIVVLGHDHCGAVTAALAGDGPGWLEPVMQRVSVTPAHDTSDEAVSAAVDAHVHETVAELRGWLETLAIDTEAPLVAGAAYRLDSGEIHWLD
jgi:carbonic anhydrase